MFYLMSCSFSKLCFNSSIDPELKEELVSIIKKLLSERTTIVIGSAVMAFSEVCPERSDLIHPNFRKLCTLLIDVDEWGQLVILNVLTRYARENFCDPNSNVNLFIYILYMFIS